MSISFNDIKKLYVPYNGASTEIKQILRNGVVIWQGGNLTFKFTGSATLNGSAITPNQEYDIDVDTNFVIRFLTSGTLTVVSTGTTYDIFCVGGGGCGGTSPENCCSGGGGGGYGMSKDVSLSDSATYSVVVGSGGTEGQNGSNSTLNGVTGYGGNVGISQWYTTVPGGEIGGGYGGMAANDYDMPPGGNGYGEFNEGSLAYGGGGGGACIGGTSGGSYGGGGGSGGVYGGGGGGVTNTGGGGGGGWDAPGGTGGSGIVCLRNHR